MKLHSTLFQILFTIASFSRGFKTIAFVTVPPRNIQIGHGVRLEDISKIRHTPGFENVVNQTEANAESAIISKRRQIPRIENAINQTEANDESAMISKSNPVPIIENAINQTEPDDKSATISNSNQVPTHKNALTAFHQTRLANLPSKMRGRPTRSEPKYSDFNDEITSRSGGSSPPGNLTFPATYLSELKDEPEPKKIVCYYDRTKYYAGILDLNMVDLNASMSLCTHLIYGYAMVDGDSGRISLSHAGMHQLVEIQHIQMIHALRSFYPGFKLLLGIGAPPSEHNGNDNFGNFNKVLESDESQFRFINSVLPILQRYEFDGIDLLWKFQQNAAEKGDDMPMKNEDCGVFCKMWRGVTDAFSVPERKENHVLELRHKFTKLVKGLKTSLLNYTMAVSVLPQMNSVFYDKQAINYYADQIHLLTFDFLNPWNKLGLAELTAPLSKVDRMVNDWLWENASKNKLVIGVAAYARTWKIASGNLFDTSPPVVAEGIGSMGPYTKKDGLLSFYEVCIQMVEDGFTSEPLLLNKAEETDQLGPLTFAYRMQTNFSDGLWVSFDDPTSMAIKAKYVKENSLGGMILHGLVFDDFKGMCAHKYKNKLPLLRSIKENID